VDPLPVYREPVESVRQDITKSERYPLYLLTPNTKNRIHSQFNNLALIRQFSQKPLLALPPAEAAARQIHSGDLVRVFNERGQFELEARIDFGVKAGCAVVTNGWWLSEGGAVNLCSLGRETDLGYGAAFHDNLVQVVKVEAKAKAKAKAEAKAEAEAEVQHS
jgi:anaerobic selenocysteine-containing dehydrogenase